MKIGEIWLHKKSGDEVKVSNIVADIITISDLENKMFRKVSELNFYYILKNNMKINFNKNLTFYHISDKDLGPECVFKPNLINWEYEFKHIPRICVAPSILQCMLAIGGVRGNYKIIDFFVYSISIDKLNPALDMKTPKKIEDYHITKEAWIIKSMMFTKVGHLIRHEWGGYDTAKNRFTKLPKFTVFMEDGIVLLDNKQ